MSAFFSNPENWTAFGFVVFVALVGRRAWTFLTGWLDGRSAEIRARLDEAVRLREEAQALLASYERKHREAEKDAEDIVALARADAARMAADAAEALEASVQRRTELAMERIARAEATALKEVRETAIDIAVRGAERLIAAELDETKAEALIDDAIKDLGKRLH